MGDYSLLLLLLPLKWYGFTDRTWLGAVDPEGWPGHGLVLPGHRHCAAQHQQLFSDVGEENQ